jgi:hypothetical protein
MFIKSDFIPHIPDCPTYSGNDDGIESLRARGISDMKMQAIVFR